VPTETAGEQLVQCSDRPARQRPTKLLWRLHDNCRELLPNAVLVSVYSRWIPRLLGTHGEYRSSRPLVPERSFPRVAIGASALRFSIGLHPALQRQRQLPGHLRPFALDTHDRLAPPLRSVLHDLRRYYDLGWLFAPLRVAFQAWGEISPRRRPSFTARWPDLRHLRLVIGLRELCLARPSRSCGSLRSG